MSIRGVCPRFHIWIQEIYRMHGNATQIQMESVVRRVWEKVLKHSEWLERGNARTDEEFHLLPDWSQEGMGYSLFIGDPSLGRLVGLNSKSIWERNRAVT